MENKSNRVSDEEIKKKACETIDIVSENLKKESRSFFNLLVERSVDTLCEVYDKYVEQMKRKVKNGK